MAWRLVTNPEEAATGTFLVKLRLYRQRMITESTPRLREPDQLQKASFFMTAMPSSLTRRVLLALTCAAALSAPLFAQDSSAPPPPPAQQQDGPGRGRGGPEMQQRQLDHMTRALNLTPDQVTQIKAIEDDSRQQMMALRSDSSTAGPDRRAKMKDIHDAQETKVKAVLNDDQRTKYDAMQAKMRERREQHHDGDQAPPPPPLAS